MTHRCIFNLNLYSTPMATSTGLDKLPDVEAKASIDDVGQGQTIAHDANGDTIVTREDGETIVISRKAERRLLWKFDLHILPLLAMMYLFNSLDKSNLGNAKTAGLEKDLGMAGTNKW